MFCMTKTSCYQDATTKKPVHKSFNAFCWAFQEKFRNDFRQTLDYFAAADLVEEYKPSCLKAGEYPATWNTFCFLEGTNFGWCTLWLDEIDSTTVRCELRFAGHGGNIFKFPRGLSWGKRHDAVFDIEVSNKGRNILRALKTINQTAGEKLLEVAQATKKLVLAVEQHGDRNKNLTGTIVAIIKNWNEAPKPSRIVYDPYKPDTRFYPLLSDKIRAQQRIIREAFESEVV